MFIDQETDCTVSTSVTGNTTNIQIEFPARENDGFTLEIFNELGQKCVHSEIYYFSYASVSTNLPTGLYFLKITPVQSEDSIIKKVVIY